MMRHASTILFLAPFLVLAGCGQEPERTPSHALHSGTTTDSLKPSALLTRTQRELRKEELMRAGRYDCCMKPGCTECIGSQDSCGCYLAIKTDEPICGECYDGYTEGKGKLKLVSIPQLERIRNERKKGN